MLHAAVASCTKLLTRAERKDIKTWETRAAEGDRWRDTRWWRELFCHQPILWEEALAPAVHAQ